jgi:hypothetical protein
MIAGEMAVSEFSSPLVGFATGHRNIASKGKMNFTSLYVPP